MSTQERRRTDPIDPWPSLPEVGHRSHLGGLLLATVLGVGLGLLAAPQPGTDTRRAVKKRLAAVGEDLGEELEDLEKRSRPLRKAVRQRAEELRKRGRKKYEETLAELEDYDIGLEENEGSGPFGALLTIGAGLAAAYLMTSERAAPTRERVREAAATVRDEAEARWDRFQRRRDNGAERTETTARSETTEKAEL